MLLLRFGGDGDSPIMSTMRQSAEFKGALLNNIPSSPSVPRIPSTWKEWFQIHQRSTISYVCARCCSCWSYIEVEASETFYLPSNGSTFLCKQILVVFLIYIPLSKVGLIFAMCHSNRL